tara:strand:+ start:6302 stop:7204 length:903 start_codon:yes stop_codon:yes gene_type:complete
MGKGGGASVDPLRAAAAGTFKNLLGKAETFALGDRGGFVPYTAPAIAGLTAQEQAAGQAAQEMFDRGDVAGQFAAQQLASAERLPSEFLNVGFQEFDTGQMERRMSPFIEGVISPQLREAEQAFDRRLRQNQAQSIAQGGAMGSYRQGLERMGLESERAQKLSDIRGAGMQRAFEDAARRFQTDRATQLGALTSALSGAQGLAAAGSRLGTESLAREQALARGLERAGAIERELAQRQLDFDRAQFVEERDFPMRRMQELSAIISGAPGQLLRPVPQQAPLASQLASLGLTAAGIKQAFG